MLWLPCEAEARHGMPVSIPSTRSGNNFTRALMGCATKKSLYGTQASSHIRCGGATVSLDGRNRAMLFQYVGIFFGIHR